MSNKKHTTVDKATAFFARVDTQRDVIAQAEKDLNTILGNGVLELGVRFSQDGQHYMIRKRSGEYYLCQYKKAPGSHFRHSTKTRNAAEVQDLVLPPAEDLIELSLEVGESLLHDPLYGSPDVPPNPEPTTRII